MLPFFTSCEMNACTGLHLNSLFIFFPDLGSEEAIHNFLLTPGLLRQQADTQVTLPETQRRNTVVLSISLPFHTRLLVSFNRALI